MTQRTNKRPATTSIQSHLVHVLLAAIIQEHTSYYTKIKKCIHIFAGDQFEAHAYAIHMYTQFLKCIYMIVIHHLRRANLLAINTGTSMLQ